MPLTKPPRFRASGGSFSEILRNKKTVAQSMDIPSEAMAMWGKRTQQIMPAEMFCAIAAPFNPQDDIRGRDVIYFIDNESAVATLIRGSSG